MKALISSLKRTLWFKASVAFFTCLLFLIFPSCQKDELSQGSIADMDGLSSSASSKKVKLTGKVKDVDGNWYKTVKIGDQWWMSENLRSTRYNDRTPIPLETDGGNCGTEIPPDGMAWSFLTTPAYCWYDNNIINKNLHGALYNWYVADPTNTKNVCPSGWHVPTDGDWTILTDYLAANGHSGTEGTALKAVNGWILEGNGTDDYGFTALPSGARDLCGPFIHLGENGCWWSSTEISPLYSYCRYVSYYNGIVTKGSNERMVGFSVRCLKD